MNSILILLFWKLLRTRYSKSLLISDFLFPFLTFLPYQTRFVFSLLGRFGNLKNPFVLKSLRAGKYQLKKLSLEFTSLFIVLTLWNKYKMWRFWKSNIIWITFLILVTSRNKNWRRKMLKFIIFIAIFIASTNAVSVFESLEAREWELWKAKFSK